MTTNNSKNTYFVQIEPTGYFFFGNEQSFNTSENVKHGAASNYFAKSNQYPQQTAILGLIRHSLLVFFNSLEENIIEKNKIIGENNFNGVHTENFGYINSISPLVIYKKGNAEIEFLTPAPFTQQEENKIIASFTDSASFINKKADKTIILKDFDYKKYETKVNWQNKKGDVDKNIFEKSLTKVGIDIKNKEDAFFKQELHKLKKEYGFGVWITFNQLINAKPNFLIPFGGDQSVFKITFHNTIENIFDKAQTPTENILLLSDAYIDSSIFDYIDFAINAYTNFRYINSKQKNYYQINGGNKSDKSILMQRGSVLYCKDTSKVTAHLRSKTAFRKIGYNYFKFI